MFFSQILRANVTEMPGPGSPYKYIAEILQDPKTLAAVYSNALALIAPDRLATILPSISLPNSLWDTNAEPGKRMAQSALVLTNLIILEELTSAGNSAKKAKSALPTVRSEQLNHLPKHCSTLPDNPLPTEEGLIISRYTKKAALGGLSDAERTLDTALHGGSQQKDGALKPASPVTDDHEQGWRAAQSIAPIREDNEAQAWGLAELFWHLLALKNWTTAAHCVRVGDLCTAIAGRRSVPEEKLRTLLVAGLLHDIGKLGVSSALLEKEGDLEPPERSKMRSHARLGEELLSVFPTLRDAALIVGRHHEKCDGTGYPVGLSGTEIDPLSRILTVADVYDALAYERPYRAALDQADIFAIMRHDMASALDQSIVADLHEVLAEESLAS